MKKSKPIKIAPSLLSANFAILADEVAKCEKCGADILHIDVMDGHFVPNITIGPLVVEAIRPLTKLPLDCHLMISEPAKYIEAFAAAGADMISVHVECETHLHRTIGLIKSLNKMAGIVLNPATPLEFAFNAVEYCDFILLMSVNPGFGGQEFIPSFLRRAELLREFLIKKSMDNIEIEVDGGVKADNVGSIVQSGANIIVCGSGLFLGNFDNNIKELRHNAELVKIE